MLADNANTLHYIAALPPSLLNVYKEAMNSFEDRYNKKKKVLRRFLVSLGT